MICRYREPKKKLTQITEEMAPLTALRNSNLFLYQNSVIALFCKKLHSNCYRRRYSEGVNNLCQSVISFKNTTIVSSFIVI